MRNIARMRRLQKSKCRVVSYFSDIMSYTTKAAHPMWTNRLLFGYL